MAAAKKRIPLEVAGREISISSPDRIYFPEAGHTKLDLVRYYVAVADGALRGAGGRPNVMKRFVKGIGQKPFFQKRAPKGRPEWLETVTLRFPSGRTAEEVVPDHPAAIAWMANMGCIDLNPHPVRADDLDHPDELRVDLDPVPGVEWPQILEVAGVVREALSELDLIGWPKTSGSRGVHVNVRLHRRWGFDEVRRAALAIARDVERRAPAIATSKWWKEERHGVFLDYNQNAKDRTVASAYSVRPTPDARVSMPLSWDELLECDPRELTLSTVPAIYAERGDRHAGIDDAPCDSRPCARARRAPRVRGRRRRALAAALPQGSGRAEARAALAREGAARRARASTAASPAPHDREVRRRGRGARAASSAGRRGTPRRPRTSRRATSSSTRCEAAPRPGPASA